MWDGNIKFNKAEDKENVVSVQFYTQIASFVLCKTNNKW